MRPISKHLYEFGRFRLDTGDRMLTLDGVYVPLTPKAFETLVVLVARGGRIVDKEELLRQVWPDTFVEDVSLAKNISILRKLLGELGAEGYIETVPRRGYRFVEEVRVLEQSANADTEGLEPAATSPESAEQVGLAAAAVASASAVASPTDSILRKPPLTFGLRTLFLLALMASGSSAAFIYFRHVPAVSASLNTVPLTSYPGRQNQAAFSPDGNHIAFSWRGPQGETPHIYLKLIGSESLLPLTHGAGSDSKPAWSPDGQYVSFLRCSPQGRAWYVIPALGGAERKVADVFPYFDLGLGNSPYYSPDGSHLAIVDKNSSTDPSAIFLVGVSKAERRRLTTPPPGSTGDYYPAFSPDGKQVAFARALSFSSTDLYIVPLAGGQPRRITFDGLSIHGLTWTADGREIVFSSRRGGSVNCLWRVPVKGGQPERLNAIGKDVISPALSAHGNRLAYTQDLDDLNIWRMAISPDGPASGQKQVIASTFRDADPDYSPDGQKIVFSSNRSGGFGIWISDSDGANPRMVFDGGPYVTGSPHWSPDGRSIAFDSRTNDHGAPGVPSIYVINAEGGHARRMTEDAAASVAPTWSRDGQSIYFASTRTGGLQTWKMPAAGGAAVQITRHGGFEAFESPDGKFLYYLKGRTIPGIWRVPIGGGEETLFTNRDDAGMWRYWRVTNNGIYYATAMAEGPMIRFMNFSTGQIREISRLVKEPDLNTPGLAISADGRFLLYAQDDQNGSNIMMTEGFR